VVDATLHHWGSGRVEVVPQDGAMHEAGLLNLNCAKARKELDWRPRWDFPTTIERTVGWYRDQHHGAPAIEITREHIRKYMEARS
jgi:CDP-glucose 4,6-dehydratase